jgi:hypothetical protein
MRKETIGLATLYLGDCREVLSSIGGVNHIITDPPYSARTHAGHGAVAVNLPDGTNRVSLGYEALSSADCVNLALVFSEMCDGWIVWMTDHTLVPTISTSLESTNRYVFAPLPFYQAGRSVRLNGDGPCSWTDWIVVSRTAKLRNWGTLPGGYIAGEGWNDKARMGGKPTALMQLLVNDYSRVGELVCDPFMGAGTTGVAAVKLKRQFIGVEIDVDAFEISCRRIEEAQRQGDLFRDAAK